MTKSAGASKSRKAGAKAGAAGSRLSAGAIPRLTNLGLLGELAGAWRGTGFNLIWRPHFPQQESTHFLQLNLTSETLTVDAIGAPIPNRGLGEADITLFGMRYLQQLSDANFPPPQGGGALHLEPGLWVVVPPNVETPGTDDSVVRMGSIPHGTTILAQGAASVIDGAPVIPAVSITPFTIGNPNAPVPFPTSDLATPSSFRTDPLPAPITQALVDNPNSFLTDTNAATAAQGFVFLQTTTIDVTTDAAGATGNIPFLGPNAESAEVSATYWIGLLRDPAGKQFVQLQYTQTVLLNFAGLSWPHVTVGSLVVTT